VRDDGGEWAAAAGAVSVLGMEPGVGHGGGRGDVDDPAFAGGGGVDRWWAGVRRAGACGGHGFGDDDTYDANGNLATTTDAEARTTTYVYDAADQLIEVVRPDQSSVLYDYDLDGNLTGRTDGAGNTTTYAYGDPAHPRLVSAVTDPNQRSTSYRYDRAGNLVSKTDPGGSCAASPPQGCTSFGYDDADQLVSVDYSDPATPDVTAIGYDELGRRTSMTDGTGTSSWTYDSLGRLSSHTDGSGTTTGYGYDLNGQVSTLAYPGGTNTVTRAYDDAGRLRSITDWLSNTTTFGYDPSGNLTAIAYPNGTTSARTFDETDRLVGITHSPTSSPTNPFASFAYTRHDDGLLASATATGVTQPAQSYGYGALGQLANVNDGTYSYDSADNLTAMPGGPVLACDDANQITTAPYDHDSRGNRTAGLTLGEETAYTYDQANRLVGVERQGQRATTRESVSSTGTQSNGIAYKPAVSADGRWVAFPSAANNLVAGDTNGVRDVFIRDRDTGTTSRILGVNGAQASNSSHEVSISDDGRYIAFRSDAYNLVPGDTNAAQDVFVHDRVANTTTRASVSSAGTQANAESPYVAISGNGRYAVFSSAATNLVTGDTNNQKDIFVRDLQTSATTRVSVGLSNTQPNAESRSPVISRDGRYVAYSSYATNLVSGDTNGKADIFLYDRDTATTTRISVSTTGTQANNASDEPTISADGATIAFGSSATNLVTGDSNAATDVFAHDRATGSTTRVSVSSNGTQGDGTSGGRVADNRRSAYISADGRYVMFGSEATNLVASDTNATTDVFVRDRTAGTTTRVSVASDGSQANGKNVDGALSADGTHVVFASTATNLVTGDTNSQQDIFLNGPGTATLDATYTYDGDGLRTSKTVNATQTDYAWDHTSGLPLLLTENTTSYLYGPGGVPVAQITGTTVTYLHQDQLGSTRVLTDATGTAIATYTYDPHGTTTAHTGSTTNLQYAGQYTDTETGHQYLRARYYDPTTGQFLTRDPIEAVTREPYSYAGNDPVNGTDPSGLYCLTGKNPNGSCRSITRGAAEKADDAWDATGGKVVSAANDFEWNACLNSGFILTAGYCHNFVGVRPNGGRAQVGVGITAWGSATVGPGRYAPESVSASFFKGVGGGIGRDLCNDSNYIFGGVGAGFSLQYSATPEKWEERFPGIRQRARDLLDWLSG